MPYGLFGPLTLRTVGLLPAPSSLVPVDRFPCLPTLRLFAMPVVFGCCRTVTLVLLAAFCQHATFWFIHIADFTPLHYLALPTTLLVVLPFCWTYHHMNFPTPDWFVGLFPLLPPTLQPLPPLPFITHLQHLLRFVYLVVVAFGGCLFARDITTLLTHTHTLTFTTGSRWDAATTLPLGRCWFFWFPTILHPYHLPLTFTTCPLPHTHSPSGSPQLVWTFYTSHSPALPPLLHHTITCLLHTTPFPVYYHHLHFTLRFVHVPLPLPCGWDGYYLIYSITVPLLTPLFDCCCIVCSAFPICYLFLLSVVVYYPLIACHPQPCITFVTTLWCCVSSFTPGLGRDSSALGRDIWLCFVALTPYPPIRVSSLTFLHSSLAPATLRIVLLYCALRFP